MASVLAANAIVGLAELKAYLSPNATSLEMDTALERCINRASSLIERALDRRIVSQGEIVEYHTLDGDRWQPWDLWLSQYPVISVTSVHESTSRTYDADSLLAVSADYIVSAPLGRLIRVTGTTDGRDAWATGFRTVKVAYLAGYQSPAGLPATATAPPQHLVDAALKVSAKLWAEQGRQLWGLSGQSDGSGNWTRFEAAALSRDIMAQIAGERRASSGATTWEIDA